MAILAQVLIFPVFVLQASLADNLPIAGIFTAISVVRSRSLRRVFEAIRTRSLIPESGNVIKGEMTPCIDLVEAQQEQGQYL